MDIANNTALHLNAWQTPSAKELAKKGLNLLTYSAGIVADNAKKFKEFSDDMVADDYFSKKPFVDAILLAGLHFISRLRDDSVLKYKYAGEKTGKKELQKSLAGKWMLKILTPAIFA